MQHKRTLTLNDPNRNFYTDFSSWCFINDSLHVWDLECTEMQLLSLNDQTRCPELDAKLSSRMLYSYSRSSIALSINFSSGECISYAETLVDIHFICSKFIFICCCIRILVTCTWPFRHIPSTNDLVYLNCLSPPISHALLVSRQSTAIQAIAIY